MHNGLLACSTKLLAHRRHHNNSSDAQGLRSSLRGSLRGGSLPLAWRRWQGKHRQWQQFCVRYQLPTRQRLSWWPYAAITVLRRGLRPWRQL